jgi:hypothetical protein
MRRPVRIICTSPIIVPLTNIQLDYAGVAAMARWVADNRPECMPEDIFSCEDGSSLYQDEDIAAALFPHDMMDADPFWRYRIETDRRKQHVEWSMGARHLSGAELLPEL